MDLITSNDENKSGFSFFWRIENFNCKMSDSLLLYSPLLDKNDLTDSRWQIYISHKNNCLSCYLRSESTNKWKTAKFSLLLLTGTGWITIVENENATIRNDLPSFGRNDFITVENLKNNEWFYLPNGSLTVAFLLWDLKQRTPPTQVLFISRLIHSDKNRFVHRPIQWFSTLKRGDLLCFPPSYKFKDATEEKPKEIHTKCRHTQTDENFDVQDDGRTQEKFVTFRTADGEYVLPKAVLSTNSSVFQEMFDKDPNCESFDIDDIHCDTLSLIINHLSSESLSDITWDAATKLFDAAFKYQINSLKAVSVTFLKDKLSAENVCHVFLMSREHQLKDLMSCAQEYFSDNLKEILLSEQWRSFMISHGKLAADVLSQFAAMI